MVNGFLISALFCFLGSPVSRSSPCLEKQGRKESPAIHDFKDSLSAEESNLGENYSAQWLKQQSIQSNEENTLNEIGISESGRLSQNNTETLPSTVSFGKSNMVESDKNTDVSIIVDSKETSSAKLEHKERILSISKKLSSSTLKQIDEMLNDYMKDTTLSLDALQKREEELSALLQLLPIDDSEMNDAEMLIHLRLHYLQDDNDEVSYDMSVHLVKDLKEEEVCQDSTNGDMVVEDSVVVDELVEGNADTWENATDLFYNTLMLGNETVFANTSDLMTVFEIGGFTAFTDFEIEDKQAANGEELNALGEKKHDDLGSSQNDDKSTWSENSEKHDYQTELFKASDTELQYWNMADKQKANHVETVDTKWDDSDVRDNWDKVEGETEHIEIVKKETSKPQRIRKEKNIDRNVKSDSTELEFHENFKESKTKVSTDNPLTESNQYQNHQKDSTLENNIGNDLLDINIGEIIGSDVGHWRFGMNDVENDDISVKEKSELVCDSGDTVDNHIENQLRDCNRGETQDSSKASHFDKENRIEKLDCVDNEENSGLKTVNHISDDRNNVPSLHNSSLDLLNKAYANVDLIEDLAAQDNVNLSNISSHNCKGIPDVSQVVVCTEVVKNENETSLDKKREDGNTTNILDKKLIEESKVKIPPINEPAIPKKKSQRTLVAKFQTPLISYEEKQKLFSKDWTTLTSSPLTPTVQNDIKSDQESLLNLVDNSTMTFDDDFRDVANLARGGFIDSSLKYIIGRCVKIVNDNHTSSCESNIITKVRLIHKSTCTDDLKDISYSDSVRFLKTCFPDIAEDELECVLVNCHNNVEWAINLLLDWKYSLHLTEEEKQQFVNGMEKVKLANEPLKQPSSLTDLCFKQVESQSIATRDELEVQLIEISKERLHRIEDENMMRLRLHRSTSVNGTLTTGEISSSFAKRPQNTFNRSQSTPSMVENQESFASETFDSKQEISEVEVINDNLMTSDETVSNTDIIKVGVTENTDSDVCGINLVTCTDEVEMVYDKYDVPNTKISKIRKKIKQRELATPDNEATSQEFAKENLKQDTEELDLAEVPSSLALTVDLPIEIVGQLEKMFGPLHTTTGMLFFVNAPTSKDLGHMPSE